MVSLAFVISFVASAVAMLIGIVIFSDVSEAMGATITPILVEIPTDPEVDGSWYGREHCPSAGCSLSAHPENRVSFFGHTTVDYAPTHVQSGVPSTPNPPESIRLVTGSSLKSTDGYIGRVFDKAELDGKQITVELRQVASFGTSTKIQIFDGEVDAIPFGACGIDCFPTDAGVVTSGSGGALTVFATPSGAYGKQFFQGTADLSSFDSPTDKVTLVVKLDDNHTSWSQILDVYSIEIEDKGIYLFKLDPSIPSWGGTHEYQIVRQDRYNSGLHWDSTVLFSSYPPPPLPVFNSEDTINANEKFENAKNIGFTVIGVMPIALFFGLFTILSPRVDE